MNFFKITKKKLGKENDRKIGEMLTNLNESVQQCHLLIMFR